MIRRGIFVLTGKVAKNVGVESRREAAGNMHAPPRSITKTLKTSEMYSSKVLTPEFVKKID